MLKELSRWFSTPLFQLGQESISLAWLMELLLGLLLVVFVARLIKRFLKYRLLERLGIDSGNREAIATLVSYGIGAIGFLLVMQTSGFDLATYAVIAGGLGVGIGFGLQDITKNLVSGITLLIERKLKVGDLIELENISGYIEEISIRSAVVRTLAGDDVIIPNSRLVESQVVNKTYRDTEGRITIPVGVAYNSDLVLVTEVLLNCAYLEPDVLNEPPPRVVFLEFGESALNFELWVWTEQIERSLLIKSSLNFIIEHSLRTAQIEIPFPQCDILLKNPRELDLSSHPKQSLPEELAKQPRPEQRNKPRFLRNLLRQVSYFQALNDLHLRQLIEMGYRQHLNPEEILFHQGDRANSFCIVLSGAIAAIYEQEMGETHIFTFSAGQFFGELPLMLGVPYPTTMKATSDSILFIIGAAAFGKLLQHHPELSEEIVQALAQRQEVLEEHEKQLGLHLVDTSDRETIVGWLRKQIKQLFQA